MDYGQQFCEAASIIAQSIVDNVKMDKTVKAYIEKNNDITGLYSSDYKVKGEYVCRYENMVFLAYGAPFY